MKSFLYGLFGDLLDVVERIKIYIDREYRELKTVLALAITRTPASVSASKVKVFNYNLTTDIMLLGLKLAVRQYNYVVRRDFIGPCEGRWERIFGVPCYHVIHRYLDSAIDGVISKVLASDFAERWTVARMKEFFEMAEPRDEGAPATTKTLGRPKGAPNKRQ